jgi:UDP-N-acetylmuramoyl-tripeptide--D-alanyl-D-alanine ligase
MISMNLSEAASRSGARLIGADVSFAGCSIDSRTVQKGNLFIALRGEKFDGHSFIGAAVDNGACAALVEDKDYGISIPLLVAQDARQAMINLAGSWRNNFDIPVLAVTGSNGKTTVKEMLRSVLGRKAQVLSTQGNLNNDIGVPLTLFGLDAAHEFAVIEMGANHAGEIAMLSKLARPDVAVITQCAPAHLEGFGSIDGVARAKAEIYSGLAPHGTAVINADDDYAGFWRDVASRYRQISFGITNQADVRARDIRIDAESGRTEFTLETPAGSGVVKSSLPGNHNVMNALAAAACCLAVEVAFDDIKQGLENTPTVQGRLQLKTTATGIRVLDDTYNANLVSLTAGIRTLMSCPGKHWLVFGDMGELGEYTADMHRQAGETARQQGVDRLYALGIASKHAVEVFGQGARHYDRIEDLLDDLQRDIRKDIKDINLLVKGSRFMAMDRVVKSLMEGNG